MAFTVINVPSGGTGAYTAVAADGSNGNKFQNDGKLRLTIINPNTNSITCTIVTPSTLDGNAVSDHVVGAQSDAHHVVKALDPAVYNVQSGTDKGAVTMTWTGTLTGVLLLVS